MYILRVKPIANNEVNIEKKKHSKHGDKPLQTHDVVSTSIRRRIDIEMTSCVYRDILLNISLRHEGILHHLCKFYTTCRGNVNFSII